MNYVVESSGKPWLVFQVQCLNGHVQSQCFDYEDLQASKNGSLYLDASECGSSFTMHATFTNGTAYYNPSSSGSQNGHTCSSYMIDFLSDNMLSFQNDNYNFCSWDGGNDPYLPKYTDGTAPTCEGSCKRNWYCGTTKAKCWTGHKDKCIHKDN
eukprot:Pgem_evm1s17749